MKNGRLLDALGRIDDRYISEAAPPTRQAGSGKKEEKRGKMALFFRKPAAAAAAIAVAVLLAVPVRAEITNGYVSNLLAPLYGGSQTELVEQIGRPVGASVTVGDYRLTADAIIGDRYNMGIVYSLTRTDGGPLEEGLCFEQFSNTARRGSGGGSYHFQLSGDRQTLFIVDSWTAANRLQLNRMATVTFTNLIRSDPGTREEAMVEAGEWSLKFTVRYEDSSIRIPARNTVVQDAAGKEYRIRRIVVSPVGIHLDLTVPNPEEEFPYRRFTLSVILKDGTVITLKDQNFSAHGRTDSDQYQADVGAVFEELIPLDQMQAIVICGTAFAVPEH